MQWGDLTFTNEPIGTFQGFGSNNRQKFLSIIAKHFESSYETDNSYQRVTVDSRNVHINYLLNRFNENSNDSDIYEDLIHEITTTKKYNKVFEKFNARYKISGVYFGSTNFDCYRETIQKINE